MKKRKVVPDFIYEKKKGKTSFLASVLLIDIVGFTRLTRQLMQESVEGAEILHSILQTFFSDSIDIISRQNGFIAHFEGDGFLAIFPQEKNSSYENALSTALEIVQYFKKNGKITTKLGNVFLKIRVSLAFGKVSGNYLAKNHLFFMSGSVVDKAKHSLEECKPNQIIADASYKKKFQDYEEYFRNEKRSNNVPKKWNSIKKSTHCSHSDFPKNEEQFEQINVDFKGEFRDIIACFLQIKSDKFPETISHILTTIKEYKGFFKDINIHNGNYTLLIYFGAPNSIEQIFAAATDFSLSIIKQYRTVVKISLTFSNSFIGFFDILDSTDFVSVGSGINLAARLLEQAKWGEIVIDKPIHDKIYENYEMEWGALQKLKGFARKINWYKLIEKKEQQETIKNLLFVGRTKELTRLHDFVHPLEQRKFAGIFYLEGKAGIGKSFLLQEFHEQTKQHFLWLHMSGNPIIKTSFQPVKECLKRFFYQQNNSQQKERHFQTNFDSFFMDFFNANLQPKAETIKSALAAFLGLKTEKEFEYFSPEIQFRKKILALDMFFLLLASQKPLIIAIDDAPSLDNDTLKWLQEWIPKAKNSPIAIVTTVRKETKHTHFSFFSESKPFETFMELKKLNKQEIYSLIHHFAENQKIEPEIEQLIYKKSAGIPLFAQQFSFYFLHQRKKQQFDDLEVPTDIRLIISTRVEKLNFGIKKVIKVAAVIGETFTLSILMAILPDENMKTHLECAKNENIFVQLSQTEYSFSHSLIRDTIYQIQMKKELREFHSRIAEAYIEQYKTNKTDVDATIAYHFEKAEVIKKAIEFYLKAAVTAKKNYFNETAMEYVKKLLSYEKDLTAKQYMKALIIKIEVLKTIGNWKEAEELTTKALVYAETYGFIEEKADLFTSLGWLEYMKGHFEISLKNLNSAIDIFSQLNHQKGLSYTLEKKAIILMRCQKWQEAEKLFQQKIEWDETHNNKKGLSSSYLNYAVFLNGRGQIEDSKTYYYKGLEISKEIHDKPSLCTANGNLAIIYLREKNFDKAQIYFEEALKLTLESGEQRPLVYLYGNFGNLFLMKLNLRKASELFEKQHVISKKLNYPHGIILSYINKNNLEVEKGHFETAFKHLEKALIIAEKGNIQQDIFTILKSRSRLFFMLDDFDEALASSKEILKLSLQKNNHYSHCISLQGIGMIYKQKNDWQKAISYFDEAINLAETYSFQSIRLQCWEKKLELFYKEEKYQTVLEIMKQEELLKNTISNTLQIIALKSEFQMIKDRKRKQQILTNIENEIDTMKDEIDRLAQKADVISFYLAINKKQIFQNKRIELQKEIEKSEKKRFHFETEKKMKQIKEKVGSYAARI